MYDFWFGSRDEICANEERYLLFVKRMLPRWSNSIPDSEYLAIHLLYQRSIFVDGVQSSLKQVSVQAR